MIRYAVVLMCGAVSCDSKDVSCGEGTTLVDDECVPLSDVESDTDTDTDSDTDTDTDTDTIPEYAWASVGTGDIDFSYGDCSSTYEDSATCSKDTVGEVLYIGSTKTTGGKTLEWKVIGTTTLFSDVTTSNAGARGYAATVSDDGTTVSWTGGENCIASEVLTNSATIWVCQQVD